jgi:hypothetical protein
MVIPISPIKKELEMSEFQGVTVVKKANVYFHGNVTSRTVIFADGSKRHLNNAPRRV